MTPVLVFCFCVTIYQQQLYYIIRSRKFCLSNVFHLIFFMGLIKTNKEDLCPLIRVPKEFSQLKKNIFKKIVLNECLLVLKKIMFLFLSYLYFSLCQAPCNLSLQAKCLSANYSEQMEKEALMQQVNTYNCLYLRKPTAVIFTHLRLSPHFQRSF